jgi:hypothetical protein
MTMKNVPITIGFTVITISQFAVGMYIMVLAVKEGGEAT